ncbi:peptidylprolyl isomerase [Geoalkalibacter halelectricus]|uniref:Peptidylprolyl isomerase n=1 Tax=Geoalkalibacter halelectricus TaxID=2847045 RepID=A0ABY5ZK16_9BACT|nr:peptidylprolyl isomerase [Geoalkalibacter halelectricus]MDO3377061.1 peptidylprolyl isomerase [Geoalkalibacter halelectricus]UWZ79485.1 peptidylprolyl isomerase [Geoalkalibacter halelectricus]
MSIFRLKSRLLTVVCCAALMVGAASAGAEQDLLARVGEVPVSQFDLELTMQRRMPMQVGFHGQISSERVAEIRQEALAELIDQAYQVNWAREQRISVAGDELAAAMKPLSGRFASEQAMREAVGEETYGQLRALMFRGVLAEKARAAAVEEKIEVGGEQVRAYYDANQERYFRPRQFRASHILIGIDPSSTAEARTERRERAEELLAQARSGENFYNLAYYNSDDRTRYVGGDLGYFHEGQTVPEFEEALAELAPGEISDLVRTRFGYHIIQLVEVNEPRQMLYEEMQERIRAQLEKEERERLTQIWMDELRARYPLERFD